MVNQYTVTWQLYKSWLKDSQRRGKRRAFFLLWCVLSLVCIGGGLVFLWLGVRSPYVIGYFLFGILSLYRAFLRNLLIAKAQYKALAKAYRAQPWTRTIEFGQDGITMREGMQTMRFLYSDIVSIREKEDEISLDLYTGGVIRIYKSAFTDGDWPGCKATILSGQKRKEMFP